MIMTEKRFKSRCYEKQKNVVIYDKGEKLFDVSYRDFEDAFYLKMKLSPVIDKLNELSNQNKELKKEDELFFGQVFDILLKYQDLFNREMADEVLEELGIELTRWFE